jgi:CheY-like chemotaxis protein
VLRVREKIGARKQTPQAAVKEAPAAQRVGKASSRPAPSEGARLDGVRVIVVDDDVDTRDLLKVALTNAGAEIKTCASSAEALDTLKIWKADCLISDIGMPGEDGYDLMKKIRALTKSEGGKIPAIALTGFASVGDQNRSSAAGYQVHLSKPVVLANLTREVARLIREG